MAWALRFLVWATPLTWLACTFYGDYMQLLVRAALSIFAAVGIRVELSSMDVIAPVDLALYGGMALASVHTPWKPRLARLAVGWGILVVIEVLLVVAGITIFLMPGAPVGSTRLFLVNAIGLMGWVGAPTLWMLFFGAREMPRFAIQAASIRHHPRRPGATGAPARR